MSGIHLNDLQAALKASPFIDLLGIQAVDLDVDAASLTLKMPFTNILSRMTVLNQFHGGAIASLIDTAASCLLFSILEIPAPTINFRTDYLKPADSTDLTAKATMRRLGRSVAVIDVDVFDKNDVLIAIGRGTFGSKAG
ncbi:MAG: PaaI family thioesterase [Pseudomonadota bacterium]